MEGKNLVLAIALSALVIIVWGTLFAPPPPTIDKDQNKMITTFIEVILNQELGEPFRRDAMKKPNVVAGINPADMKTQ